METIIDYRPQRTKKVEVKGWVVEMFYTASIMVITLAGVTAVLGGLAAASMS